MIKKGIELHAEDGLVLPSSFDDDDDKSEMSSDERSDSDGEPIANEHESDITHENSSTELGN